MAKQKMGELLIRAGLIKESDVRVALAQQKTHGGKLGEHLVRMHLLSEETLARALAQQLGLDYNDLSAPPLPAIVNILPEKVSARLQVLPTAYDARTGTLTVAIGDPLDESILVEVGRITGKQVVAQVTPANTLRRGIEHAYFGVELRDEGTNEFQLVDIHGRGKKVYVGEDADLPELGTAELMPLEEAEMGGEHAAVSGEETPVAPDPSDAHPVADWPAPSPMRISPIPPAAAPRAAAPARAPAQAPRPPPRSQPAAPKSGAAPSEAGEEALRTVMALADLLVEKGYFTRSELMRALRKS